MVSRKRFIERAMKLNRHVIEGDGDAALDVLSELALAHEVRFTASGLSRFIISVQRGNLEVAGKSVF